MAQTTKSVQHILIFPHLLYQVQSAEKYSIQMYCSAFGKLLSNLSQVLVLRLFIEMDNAWKLGYSFQSYLNHHKLP